MSFKSSYKAFVFFRNNFRSPAEMVLQATCYVCSCRREGDAYTVRCFPSCVISRRTVVDGNPSSTSRISLMYFAAALLWRSKLRTLQTTNVGKSDVRQATYCTKSSELAMDKCCEIYFLAILYHYHVTDYTSPHISSA